VRRPFTVVRLPFTAKEAERSKLKGKDVHRCPFTVHRRKITIFDAENHHVFSYSLSVISTEGRNLVLAAGGNHEDFSPCLSCGQSKRSK
jgi:hypothetical protein